MTISFRNRWSAKNPRCWSGAGPRNGAEQFLASEFHEASVQGPAGLQRAYGAKASVGEAISGGISSGLAVVVVQRVCLAVKVDAALFSGRPCLQPGVYDFLGMDFPGQTHSQHDYVCIVRQPSDASGIAVRAQGRPDSRDLVRHDRHSRSRVARDEALFAFSGPHRFGHVTGSIHIIRLFARQTAAADQFDAFVFQMRGDLVGQIGHGIAAYRHLHDLHSSSGSGGSQGHSSSEGLSPDSGAMIAFAARSLFALADAPAEPAGVPRMSQWHSVACCAGGSPERVM